MKTVADFKRKLKLGVNVHTIYHLAFDGRDESGVVKYKDEDRGVREVSIVQSNSFALNTTKTDGTTQDSWCNYPKASQVKFTGENTVTILEPDYRDRANPNPPLIPVLTYTFV